MTSNNTNKHIIKSPMSIANGTISISSSTGALTVTGGLGVGGALNIAGTSGFTGITNITNSTASTSSSTGALTVTGGLGVGGAIYSAGIHNISNTTQLPSTANAVSSTSGALTLQGDLHFYNGTTNTIVFSAAGSAAPTFTNRSLGTRIVLSPAIGASSVDCAIGVTNSSTDMWYSANTTADYHYFYSGTTLNVQIGNNQVYIPLNIASTSTTTGALTVTGGVGIAGNVNVGGNMGFGNASQNGTIQFPNADVPRRLVFWESGNNNHQVTAIGKDVAIMRFQVPVNTDDHVFYSGASTTASNELFRVKGTGVVNVPSTLLIGTTSITVNATSGALTVQGDIHLYNSAGSIVFASGLGNPSYTNRSAGTKIVLRPTISSGSTDLAIGTDSTGGNIWYSAYNPSYYHYFYSGTTLNAQIGNGQVYIPTGTASSSTTTGALRITGGAGISGSLYVGSSSRFTGTVDASGNWVYCGAFNNSGSSTLSGAVTVGSTLTVNSNSDFNGTVDATGYWMYCSAFRNYGGTTLDGSTSIGGNVNVSGNVQISLKNSDPVTDGVSAGTSILMGGLSYGGSYPHSIGTSGLGIFWFACSDRYFRWYVSYVGLAMQLNNNSLMIGGSLSQNYNFSDIRLKDNVKTISSINSLNIILKLRPVTFNWKKDHHCEGVRGKSERGFIAQEVEKILPDLIEEEKPLDTEIIYKTIRHEKFTPYVVAAIQELNSKINTLETTLEAQKNRIEKLEEFIDNEFPGKFKAVEE